MSTIYPRNSSLETTSRSTPIHDQPISIQFAAPDEIRVRKVVRRSNAQRTGKYPGLKANRMMQWESKHEANAMYLLDTCPAVMNFSEQPCEITYFMDGIKHRHYPDFLVIGKDWKEFWEVKVRKDALHPEVVKRTRILTSLLPQYGYGYRMTLAEDLAINPRLCNAKLILTLGRIEIPCLEMEQIRNLFQEFETLPWGALQGDPDNPFLQRYVCRMILDGLLTFDINQPLRADTPVRWVFDQTIHGGASWESLISKKAL